MAEPSRPGEAEAQRRLTMVQRWVLSSLAVTTILHLSAGLIVAAMFLEDRRPGAETGLCLIAGGFGVMAVAAALAIHGRRILSWWLLLGVLPAAVGLWLVG